jgi:hypothetical protein
MATGWAASSYEVDIAPTTGGTVTTSPSNPVSQGATVTLTIAPANEYVLSGISAYKKGDPSIVISINAASATTRTFTMPGCDVTVTATFSPTADQQAIETAASLIPAAFSVAQATANTQANIESWLLSQISSLITSTGVTVSASNITVSAFTAATAGTALSPSGSAGSFNFTVTLTQGSAALTTATKTGTITPTAYGATPYTVTVSPTTHGTVTASSSHPVYANSTVTLTLAPSTGYGLASIQVYRTGTPSTTITLSGSGNTYTFAMPAYDVTVEATFLPTSQLSAQQDVNSARSLIENATFSVPQSTANTSAGVRTWLVQQINSLITSTGVTVSASDITVSNFTEATSGTAASSSGTDGSFTFTVSLAKNGATAVTSAKTGRIMAAGYVFPAQRTITIETSSNGHVTASSSYASTGARVTLTIAADAGYELNALHAYATGNPSTLVSLSGSGNTRTFTMPSYAVTVTATFKKTQELIDRETVEEAKVSVEGGTYRIAQATGNTETGVKTWLTGVLNLLLSGRDAAITFRSGEEDVLAADVTLTSFTSAVSGTAANPSGTNGYYRFTVVLSKGGVHVETLNVDGVIVAMPYAATPVKRIELLSMGETRLRIINTGNTETGSLTVSLSGTNAGVFTPSSAAPGSLTLGDEVDFLLIPREGIASGTYTVTVTVSGEGLTPVSLEITYRVLPTANEAIAGQRVWAAGNMLYIVATATGEARVFNTGGRFVKAIPHAAGETVVTTLPQGLYIVVAEEKMYKVVIR